MHNVAFLFGITFMVTMIILMAGSAVYFIVWIFKKCKEIDTRGIRQKNNRF